MQDASIFMDKNIQPDDKDLAMALGKTFTLWTELGNYVLSRYDKAHTQWSYPGAKHGWSLRIKDSKRAIIYLLPRDQYFKVAFVFGQKATDTILKSDISPKIKSALKAAKVYREGRGIRIDIKRKDDLDAIRFLVDVKLAN